MNVAEKLLLGSFLALSITWSAQAQSPTQGDYYAPGPTTPVHSGGQSLQRNPQGDYYVGDKMILNARRTAAIKKCTDGIKFDSDSYVACMSREGEAP
jgi:hypothetical protein